MTKRVVGFVVLAIVSAGALLARRDAAGQTLAQPPSDVRPASEQPAALRGIEIEQRLNQPVPLDLPFRDETGRAVRLGDYFGRRPVVLALVYYNCPMLCTQVLNGLVSALGVISLDAGRDFDVVAVSFDAREKPADARAKKEAYVSRYRRAGAAAGWHFLTGDEASIATLASSVGFRFRFDRDLDQFAHASAVYVLTPEGRLSRYFYGIEYPPRDLRLGLIEASAGKIGTPVDRVLLYCFHYDPTTGKYGAVVLNIVRLAGIATILVLGTAIVLLSRRPRHRLRTVPGETR